MWRRVEFLLLFIKEDIFLLNVTDSINLKLQMCQETCEQKFQEEVVEYFAFWCPAFLWLGQ